jgi:hypothetical protein
MQEHAERDEALARCAMLREALEPLFSYAREYAIADSPSMEEEPETSVGKKLGEWADAAALALATADAGEK